jgi:Gpi18-like mannosyltransferase
MSIVKQGYFYIPGKESSAGFFPLYPLLVKILSLIFGHPILIGFFISNIALLFAVIYLYKMVMLDFEDSDVASKTVFYILISPASFYFSIFYTEGLFLFLTISSFYYARKKRWLIASLLGFFLSLTRSVGVYIIIPLLMEYLDIDFDSFRIDFKKIKKDIFYLSLIPMGLLIFMLYLLIKFNDAFAYYHAQAAGWQRGFTSIMTTSKSIKLYYDFYKIIFMGLPVFVLILILFLIYFRVRSSYIVYTLLLLFIYLSTGRLESIPRYISVLFPMYMGMSLLANKSKFLDYSFSLFSTMLLTLFTSLFVNGYWFP